MTDSGTIQTAIAEALTLSISYADMAALVKRAIAAAYAVGGAGEVASVTYTIGGRSRTLALTEARELLVFCEARAGSAGGIIFAGLEFGP